MQRRDVMRERASRDAASCGEVAVLAAENEEAARGRRLLDEDGAAVALEALGGFL